jgi:hypothetical protein
MGVDFFNCNGCEEIMSDHDNDSGKCAKGHQMCGKCVEWGQKWAKVKSYFHTKKGSLEGYIRSRYCHKCTEENCDQKWRQKKCARELKRKREVDTILETMKDKLEEYPEFKRVIGLLDKSIDVSPITSPEDSSNSSEDDSEVEKIK